jgi:hypothetical protein
MFRAGNAESPAQAARAQDDFISPEPQPTFSFDRLWVSESRSPTILINSCSQGIDLQAPSGMCPHILNDLTYTCEQSGVIQHWHVYRDPVLAKLSSVTDQPGCVRQRSHRYGAIVGRHAAELITGDESCACAEVGRTQGSRHTRRSGANHDDVKISVHSPISKLWRDMCSASDPLNTLTPADWGIDYCVQW